MCSIIKYLNIIQSENTILTYSLLLLSFIVIEIQSASLSNNMTVKQLIHNTNDEHYSPLETVVKAARLNRIHTPTSSCGGSHYDDEEENIVVSRFRRHNHAIPANEPSETNFNDALRLVKQAIPDGVVNHFRGGENSGVTSVRASRNQLDSFTRLLLQRLRIKSPPNVSAYNGKSSIPDVMIKQLEFQQTNPLLQKDANPSFVEDLTKYERILIPGQQFFNHSCEKRLREHGFPTNDIECYQFLKQKQKNAPLPRDQEINAIKLYIKSGYFHNPNKKLTPDMFKIYKIFRPVPNESVAYSEKLISSLGKIKSSRIIISDVKRVKDWYELTFSKPNLKSIYDSLIYLPSGIAISKDLSLIPHGYPLYSPYSDDYISNNRINSDHEKQQDPADAEEKHYSPYLYVEYGEKTDKSQSRIRRSSVNQPTCSSSSPCCRRSLTLDFSNSRSLNFIIHPRVLDIGECVGLCNSTSIKTSHMKNSPQQNLLALSETHAGVNHQCCSYARTGGLELLYATEDKSIVRQFIPNMIVETCRCLLPAIISQV
ncbi:unnamed protein product [Didymodactylos carnosus]|uniref:TGF-beta family profile domain-containing protein n=1 Tax=Didymodactylos carnosus TaxID=1234261 RepID=A0A814NKS5_9BILA|nr:unnamed protein product [Didymodactylos carnosus]CAF3860530.1 unnamed protein product [Didymodactylos carnosus]